VIVFDLPLPRFGFLLLENKEKIPGGINGLLPPINPVGFSVSPEVDDLRAASSGAEDDGTVSFGRGNLR
jgi:hypothetical protein